MTSHKLKLFLLTKDADSDLDEIFDYSEAEFGFNKAVKYLSDFENLFEQLVKNPNLGRERNEIKKGIYSIIENEHIVFYEIHENHILIARVLHGRKDIPKFIK
ncbi:type II toxin-antitoxin system RelE/ParE family toxin [Flavobacterium sp. ASW18X]|uniref:Toxin n=1 Tax=Croceivirga radicis TaxID=1929488 RepID=A0A1V6LTA9_9FLAO|nr:type II toxin-antitoxin system RelE/ParE family toxin [Flavobacterium sp. ASW18X]OQD43415.1 plasmid stabilization protein [Croceivirga radicis]TKD65806.1 type II toxin-antitoxin system RelE/ParE family toxin [Flavobacterium sp. ASW18X]